MNESASSSTLPTDRTGVLAGGNWIVDHLKVIDAWPAQDSLASIREEMFGNGGSPYNILKNLAMLRAPFPLAGVGLIGNDEKGLFIREDCAAHGINTNGLDARSSLATSYTDVMTVRNTGRRTFFHRRGANAELSPADFDFTSTRARHFHLGYLMLLDRLDLVDSTSSAAGEVLRRATEAGLTTSVDCVSEDSDRFREVVLPALPHVDLFFANDFETERLTGISLLRDHRVDPAAARSAAQHLLDAGVRAWVIIHLPEGVFAAGANGEWHIQPSVRVPEASIVGAAGAGDALAAGVLLGWHEGRPMSDCLLLGVAAAASSLHHASCSESIPSAEECLHQAESYGFNLLSAHSP